MSALGAIVMYMTSLLALFRLRRSEANLERPFRTPWYPIFPLVALIIAAAALGAIVWNNVEIAVIFAVVGLVGGAITYGRISRGTLQPAADRLLMTPGD
jgi:ethanolamine permease